MTIKIINKHTVLLCVTALFLAAWVLFKLSNPAGAPESPRLVTNNASGSSSSLHGTHATHEQDEGDSIEQFVENMVVKLRQMHGHDIHEIKTMLALQDLRDFIVERYPEKGEALFSDIIHQAFPELSEKILSLIASMDAYETWLDNNQLALSDLMELEREGRVWKKRNELFGELAQEIFSDEITEAQQRQQAVMDTVEMLDKADDISMDERLFLLQSSMQEHLGANIESLLVDKGMISGVYFNLASVQKNLHELNAQQRQAQIDASRRQLGFSEKDIDYLAKQDAKNEVRWKNGYGYMEKREAISSNLEGEALSKAMDELRLEFFKHEAPTIAKEEQQGFYRFNRPRLYGQN